MRVTCDHCEKSYSVPDELLGGEGRKLRCGECGTRWWQDGEILESDGRSSAGWGDEAPEREQAGDQLVIARRPRSQSRTLVVSSMGQHREEQGFTSFFDGISSRFGAQSESGPYASQRFQRLRHSRQQRRDREANAIVEAEFKEIRDFGHVKEWCRTWIPRGAVVCLFAASILIVVFAE